MNKPYISVDKDTPLFHPDLLPQNVRVAALLPIYGRDYLPIGVVDADDFKTESGSTFKAVKITGWIIPPAAETD